ncbi:uncharacterized protein LOC122245916 [Penaeus japonicus]|uniref:uncharacterized protein LOC122245916 n=1 Tax=Penaeus japonicus TaxID=27405 RepID=UPI001C7120A7|nr:uncharacterized protein LOC122245916 [Penaeus japonicus]
MAASITKLRLLQSSQNLKNILNYRPISKFQDVRHCSLSPVVADEDGHQLKDRRFEFDAVSLAARGYLRSQQSYNPPKDVENQVLQLCEKTLKSTDPKTTFGDAATKYKLLSECSKKLKHRIPNSIMHNINNVEELMLFYKTPIDATVPLDMMKNMDLPKNLHVIYNYTRFHPETDTLFGGVSAFTKDSTVVSGLKTKKKYPGHTARTAWPYQ